MDLLQLEDVLIEVLLQLFVGIINAELFKWIILEHFKTKNIQHSNTITLSERSEQTLIYRMYY